MSTLTSGRTVGPGGGGGGIEWGSAADSTNVYSAEANTDKVSYTLGGSGPFAGQKTTAGSWAALNAATGNNMDALSASTGAVLWSFASGGEVRSGAAVVSGMVYWGSGYASGPNDKLYAFGLL